MRGDFCTQGKDNWDRYNHYVHKATIALFQHGQRVGNLHLNGTDNLWGKICSPNSLLSQILQNACRLERCRCWVFPRAAILTMQHCPPMVIRGTAGEQTLRLRSHVSNLINTEPDIFFFIHLWPAPAETYRMGEEAEAGGEFSWTNTNKHGEEWTWQLWTGVCWLIMW